MTNVGLTAMRAALRAHSGPFQDTFGGRRARPHPPDTSQLGRESGAIASLHQTKSVRHPRSAKNSPRPPHRLPAQGAVAVPAGCPVSFFLADRGRGADLLDETPA